MSASSSTSVNRSRRALLPTLGIIFALVVVFVIFANVFTDLLWYRALDFSSVFTTLFWTRIGLFVVFGLALALIVGGNAYLSWRLRPRGRTSSNPALDRYTEALQSRMLPLVIGLSAVLFLFGGLAAIGSDQLFLAWRNATPFGQTDFRFGLDIGFFVFSYPWWRFVIGYLLTGLILAAVVSGAMHYLLGGLRLRREGDGRRATRAANIHVSVLLALVMFGLAVNAWFDRYGRSVTTNDLLTGVRYTDDNATLIASLIIAVIAVLCGLLFAANAVVRRWTIPVVAVVLMMISNVVLGVIYPAIVQGAVVRPNEPDLERPYIEEHLAATRAAYGVDDVEITDYEAETEATAGQLRADAEALPGVRLMDPSVIGPTFEQLQQVRDYYSFSPVLDVDRYNIDGEETDSVVAVRELNMEGLPSQSWNNVRTVYTHGHGLVAAYGNRSVSGEPEWLSSDLPPTGEISGYEARVYYGEQHTEYSVVGRPEGQPPLEVDTPEGTEGAGPSLTTYDGEGGVPIGNWFSRILYAIRMGDVNLLLSERVNPESKLIYDRTPRERVQAAAPWLRADSNAYPTVVNGRIKWVVDAYTTSNSYPNSHRVSLQQATADAESQQELIQPDDQINYMRNSVKAVVDAYDGTVELYEWDPTDPVLQTWSKAFPGTLTPREEISEELMGHLRYPEDMYKVQREVLGRYHVTDPMQWVQGNDVWQVPSDPVDRNATQKQPPYYLQVRWPDEEDAVYSQTSTYVPLGRQNLAAFMAVNADATSENYGKFRVLRMSANTQIDGPNQTFNAMVTDQVVAERLRPYVNSDSAQVTHGNLMTLPVGGGLLYVSPVYTQRAGDAGGAYPALTFVMVRFGQEVGIGETLDAALDEVFGGDSGATTGENGEGQTPPDGGEQPAGEGGLSPDAAQALTEASQAFEEADAALREGDLAKYQAKIEEARAALERARGA